MSLLDTIKKMLGTADTKLKPIIEYYDDGKIKRAYSVDENGNEQGSYEEYHKNGQLSIKGTYKNGELDGPYEEYSYGKNDNLWEKVTYRYIPVSETKETPGGGRCDVNGNMLENVGVFKPELRIKEGPFEEYHANGQLYRRGINKNGKEEGPYEIYSPDGVLVEKGLYREGLPLTETGEIRKTVQVAPYRQTPSPEPSTKATRIRVLLAGEEMIVRRRGRDY